MCEHVYESRGEGGQERVLKDMFCALPKVLEGGVGEKTGHQCSQPTAVEIVSSDTARLVSNLSPSLFMLTFCR